VAKSDCIEITLPKSQPHVKEKSLAEMMHKKLLIDMQMFNYGR